MGMTGIFKKLEKFIRHYILGQIFPFLSEKNRKNSKSHPNGPRGRVSPKICRNGPREGVRPNDDKNGPREGSPKFAEMGLMKE
jgi:hypothetical protein